MELDSQGTPNTFQIKNRATVNYMQRVAREAEKKLVTVDVGLQPDGGRHGRRRRRRRRKEEVFDDDDVDFDLMSNLFYLATPFMTITAIVLEVLLEDCKSMLSLVDRSTPLPPANLSSPRHYAADAVPRVGSLPHHRSHDRPHHEHLDHQAAHPAKSIPASIRASPTQARQSGK